MAPFSQTPLMLIFPRLYFPLGRPGCSPRLHFICLPGVAAEKSFYPLWLYSEKENKQPKLPLQPSRLGKIVLILLVPGFKVHLTFYRGDLPSQGAGGSGSGLSLVDN